MNIYDPYRYINNLLSNPSNKDEYCDRKVIQTDWPENNGCQKDTKEEEFELKENEIIDRFGDNTGEYLSSPKYRFDQRSMYQVRNYRNCELKYKAWAKQNYKTFKVKKPFKVMKCKVADAFGFIGGAEQYRLYDNSIIEETKEVDGKKKVTVQDLINHSYIKKIYIPDIPSFGKDIRSDPPQPEDIEFYKTKDALSNKVNEAEKTLKKTENEVHDNQFIKTKELLEALTKKADNLGEVERKKDENFITVVIAAKEQTKEQTEKQSKEQKLVMNETQNIEKEKEENPKVPDLTKDYQTGRILPKQRETFKIAGGFNKKSKKSRKSRKSKKSKESKESKKSKKSKESKKSKKSKKPKKSKNPKKLKK